MTCQEPVRKDMGGGACVEEDGVSGSEREGEVIAKGGTPLEVARGKGFAMQLQCSFRVLLRQSMFQAGK